MEDTAGTGLGRMTGDERELIACFSAVWPNPLQEDEPSARYYVRYEITPEGLKETVLGSFYSKIMLAEAR